MARIYVGLILFCGSLTCYWAWKLDVGPFIYRHDVPSKLEKRINELYGEAFRDRDIYSMRFGEKGVHVSVKVPVAVSSDSSEKWLTQNMLTGPVLIKIDRESSRVQMYWDLPEDMAFEDSFELASLALQNILLEYDEIVDIEYSYQ